MDKASSKSVDVGGSIVNTNLFDFLWIGDGFNSSGILSFLEEVGLC